MKLNKCKMLAASLSLAAILLAPSSVVVARTNTAAILGNTYAALPSCLRYQVKGACFFLYCTAWFCRIRTSIRVAHYVPDAVVSTYNDVAHHPWSDIGKPLAQVLSQAGSAMLKMPLDSSAGTRQDGLGPVAYFAGVDVIGNPAGQFAQMTNNSSVSSPSSFAVPGISNLMQFPQELPNIARQWAAVPVDVGNQVLEEARAAALAPGQILQSIQALPAQLGQLSSSVGNVGQLLGGRTGSTANQTLQVDQTSLQSFSSLANRITGAGGSSSLFCPGNASNFSLFYQAELDALLWRSVIPVELLYPGSWVPGINEIGSGLSQTWGSLYPRTGELVQSDPVKASAVVAARAGDIVSKKRQPHIYTELDQGDKGYHYFEKMTQRTWQMLYPKADTSCHTFGANDSMGLSSFGDGKSAAADGYVWNMWNFYDCCKKRGEFLFSIP